MDEVIYLEPDEEITSVIDKLKEMAPEARSVFLVIPKGSAILQSGVNLKLLKKEGEVLGKDLSIITQDKIGRNLASQAGFTVYDNVGAPKPVIEPIRPQIKTEEIIELDLAAKKEDEEKVPGVPVHRYDAFQEREKTKTPPVSGASQSSKKKIFFCLGISLIMAGVLFYLFYPKAIITLVLKTEPLEQTVEIIIDNNINKSDTERKAIPGELQEVEQQASKKFKATGKKEVGEKAKGTITLSNESGDSQKVSAGTEIKSSDGLVFRTTTDATVPGATASVDSQGNVVKNLGKIDVAVEASEAGDKYNIGATSFIVVGRIMLSAKSSLAMSGGVSKQLTIVSQNDLNNAKSDLANEIYTTLHQELKNKAGKDKILENAIKDEILSSEADKKVGEEIEEFEMKVKVKSATISFQEKDYREMVVKALEKFIPQDKELVLSASDAISIITTDIDISHGLLKLKGTVKTKIVAKIDQKQIKKTIQGKNKDEAEAIIKQTKGVEEATVFLRPSWWLKKVPSLDRNIEVKLQ